MSSYKVQLEISGPQGFPDDPAWSMDMSIITSLPLFEADLSEKRDSLELVLARFVADDAWG
jgi:hypothetical protein